MLRNYFRIALAVLLVSHCMAEPGKGNGCAYGSPPQMFLSGSIVDFSAAKCYELRCNDGVITTNSVSSSCGCCEYSGRVYAPGAEVWMKNCKARCGEDGLWVCIPFPTLDGTSSHQELSPDTGDKPLEG